MSHEKNVGALLTLVEDFHRALPTRALRQVMETEASEIARGRSEASWTRTLSRRIVSSELVSIARTAGGCLKFSLVVALRTH